MSELNRWWEEQPAERYWMEITDRRNLGADVFAPQTDGSGNAYWGYSLVTEVRVGDIVLHWHKKLHGRPALVGWSVVAGPPEESTITWQARGTSGRAAPPSGPGPAWVTPLVDYTPLLTPISQQALRREEAHLKAVKADLEREYGGSLYFPFAFSGKRPARAAQGYLVKFPAAAVALFPELDSIPQPTAARGRRRAPRRGASAGRYQHDARVRAALERQAVNMATEHFELQGYDVEDVGSFRPYDLEATMGGESRRVEVKGSSGPAETVELTAGEVENAKAHQPTDLFVVDSIDWWRNADGSVSTSGGNVHLLSNWKPRASHLKVTSFRYVVPR